MLYILYGYTSYFCFKHTNKKGVIKLIQAERTEVEEKKILKHLKVLAEKVKKAWTNNDKNRGSKQELLNKVLESEFSNFEKSFSRLKKAPLKSYLLNSVGSVAFFTQKESTKEKIREKMKESREIAEAAKAVAKSYYLIDCGFQSSKREKNVAVAAYGEKIARKALKQLNSTFGKFLRKSKEPSIDNLFKLFFDKSELEAIKKTAISEANQYIIAEEGGHMKTTKKKRSGKESVIDEKRESMLAVIDKIIEQIEDFQKEYREKKDTVQKQLNKAKTNRVECYSQAMEILRKVERMFEDIQKHISEMEHSKNLFVFIARHRNNDKYRKLIETYKEIPEKICQAKTYIKTLKNSVKYQNFFSYNTIDAVSERFEKIFEFEKILIKLYENISIFSTKHTEIIKIHDNLNKINQFFQKKIDYHIPRKSYRQQNQPIYYYYYYDKYCHTASATDWVNGLKSTLKEIEKKYKEVKKLNFNFPDTVLRLLGWGVLIYGFVGGFSSVIVASKAASTLSSLSKNDDE